MHRTPENNVKTWNSPRGRHGRIKGVGQSTEHVFIQQLEVRLVLYVTC